MASSDGKKHVSVLDSVVQGGDAVWEGLRVADGRIYQMEEHLRRLQESAHTLMFSDIPSTDEVKQAVFKTLEANGMTDGVHIRLTLTRGEKSTSGMDPRLNVHGCTLIVLPEYKGAVYGSGEIKLVTSSIRRNGPSYLDSKIHHNNLLNNILAKIQANHAGADDAVMLDDRGFLAETNATNVFLIRDGVLGTPFGHACLPGITRGYTGSRQKTRHPSARRRLQPDRIVHRRRGVHHGHHGRIGPHCGSRRTSHRPCRPTRPRPCDSTAPSGLRPAHSLPRIALPVVTALLLSGLRVSAGFLLGTMLSWGLGQWLQDALAPHVPRPSVNDPAAVADFLAQLPFGACWTFVCHGPWHGLGHLCGAPMAGQPPA